RWSVAAMSRIPRAVMCERPLAPGPDLGPPSPAGDPVQPDAADLADALLREPICGLRRADVAIAGDMEDLPECAVDALDLGIGPSLMVALKLDGHVDEASGVDLVVGCGEDAPLGRGFAWCCASASVCVVA